MAQVINGYLGGDLLIDSSGSLTVFFAERFVTGCPAYVQLGPVAADLLALQPGEHLAKHIPGMDDIYAREAPEALGLEQPEIVLAFLSTFRHSICMVMVSQEKLRQAVSQVAAV